MIIWAKKYVKDGNKLIQLKFKSNIKNSILFSFRQLKNQFEDWSDFYQLVIGKKFTKPQKSVEVNCKNCEKNFKKKYNQISKTNNNFCSRSCAVSFNNHKRGSIKEEIKEKIRID